MSARYLHTREIGVVLDDETTLEGILALFAFLPRQPVLALHHACCSGFHPLWHLDPHLLAPMKHRKFAPLLLLLRERGGGGGGERTICNS
jgi:hypothetical protein